MLKTLSVQRTGPNSPSFVVCVPMFIVSIPWTLVQWVTKHYCSNIGIIYDIQCISRNIYYDCTPGHFAPVCIQLRTRCLHYHISQYT